MTNNVDITFVTGDQLEGRGSAGVGPHVRAQVQPGLHPLHAEVEPEGDGVVLVINGKNIGYLKA